MTSRERLLTALRLGTPDRIPVTPFGLGKLDPDGEMASELIKKTDPFICVGGGGDPFLGKDAPVETRWEGDTAVTIIHTPQGNLTRRHRYTEVTSATVEFPFKTTEDVERYFSLLYTPPEVDLTEFWRWRERVGEEALVMVGIGDAVCLPASWFSPEGFCLAWADDPDLVIRVKFAEKSAIGQSLRVCIFLLDKSIY
jgi:hypothetical protein